MEPAYAGFVFSKRQSRSMNPPDTRQPYRGRFAPSPSGPLHFGSLVAALGSYLDARHHHGRWLLRIEDLDPPREKPGAADDILRTLEAFGFEWDEAVLYQSKREDAYRAALETLRRAGLAYACACSRSEIATSAKSGIEGFSYPGTCRDGIAHGRSARSIRVRTNDIPIAITDRVCGKIVQNVERDIGDFVIHRADGLFSYQLAVVVDDALQGITHIVRGADLLLSTPRQIHLQRLLGLAIPDYAHLPLVIDAAGKKLSKQTQAQPVVKKNPLPALLAASRFLNQALPRELPGDLCSYWEWALANWDCGQVSATQSGAQT